LGSSLLLGSFRTSLTESFACPMDFNYTSNSEEQAQPNLNRALSTNIIQPKSQVFDDCTAMCCAPLGIKSNITKNSVSNIKLIMIFILLVNNKNYSK